MPKGEGRGVFKDIHCLSSKESFVPFLENLESSNLKESESLVKYQEEVRRLEEELKQSNEEFDLFQTEVTINPFQRQHYDH